MGLPDVRYAIPRFQQLVKRGKTSEKEITYLMTRRLSRDQAVSLIIRGFMNVGILRLPEALNAEIKRNVDASTGAA